MGVRLHRLLPGVAALLLGMPEGVQACPVCFAGVESPLLDSARLGVLAMAGVTVCVLGAFGVWFVKLSKMETAEATDDERPGGFSTADSRPRGGAETG